MAITNPAGNPAAYPATVERRTGDEPRNDFWTNTFDPLLNRSAYLYDQLLGATNGIVPKLASQVLTSSGSRLVGVEALTGANGQGNTLAQTLFAFLQKVWDEKGGLTIANVWGGVQDFDKGFQVSNGSGDAVASTQCQKRFLRPRVLLDDNNHTIDVTEGDRFVLPASPAAPRTITLDNITDVPLVGETITLLCPNLTTSAQPAYTIQRNDATVICEINGSTSGDAGAIAVEFEVGEGVIWKLGMNSGKFYDDNTFTTEAGIIPGAGA